jgi:hypothetical protein
MEKLTLREVESNGVLLCLFFKDSSMSLSIPLLRFTDRVPHTEFQREREKEREV